MKFLLTAINAKYIHSNLALYSLRAYAGEYAGHVKLLEYTINHRPDEILEAVYQEQPDVAAFSCYIWNLEYIRQVAEELKKIMPALEIWVGGPEVSFESSAFLKKNPYIKGVMAGEGEQTFLELLKAYLECGDICGSGRQIQDRGGMDRGCGYCLPDSSASRIAGLCFRREDGSILTTPPRDFTPMDEIPFMYSDMSDLRHRIVYYESSRGCPFSCSYCLSSIDKRVRFRSLHLVEQELQFFLDHKVPQVKFVDRTFNCSHSHALSVWKYIRDHDNGITNFHFEIAADILNDEEMALLKTMRPGLVQLEIGVQSTNTDTVREIRRVMDFEAVKRNVLSIRSARNIHQHLDLIAGLPFEDMDSFIRSFNDVYALAPDQFQLGFLKVLKGSLMHEKAGEYGILYHSRPQYEVLSSAWLPYDGLLLLKSVEEMVEVYYNSHQFERTVRRLEREFEHPFGMYEALAGFYRERGYSKMSHSRMARFKILREFIMMHSPVAERSSGNEPWRPSGTEVPALGGDDRTELYEELLTLDWYLRENSRSRPEWAGDEAVHKDEKYEFYKSEEKAPVYLKGYEGYRARQMMTMTHLEYFTHDVLGDGQKGRYRVLFDYQQRDPLNDDARAIYV